MVNTINMEVVLEQRLKLELEPLRVIFIQKTKEWTESYFNYLIKIKKEYDSFTTIDLRDNVKKNRFNDIDKVLYRQGGYNILYMGLKKFIIKEEKSAELHYSNSILKLSERIIKKGINVDKLEMITGVVGVNIETTLTDGEKTVKAWTIIAEGEIQKPHYRYLVK
jgi:hypothetical protein